MVDFGYKETEGEIRTHFVAVTTTKTTQHTTNIKPWTTNHDGKPVTRLHDKERILTHAAALQLISKKTTIPVPKLLGFGENPDGTAWIETERVTHGGIWLDLVQHWCRMPEGKKHVDGASECPECEQIAFANARRFVQDEVLPQLNSLRSDTTGLNGIVIPPLWIMDYDPETRWEPKKAAPGEEYVFCHGNLHAHSILMHAETLHVMKIVDWDNAGFLPEEFQLWTVERPKYEELFTDRERCKRLADMMV